MKKEKKFTGVKAVGTRIIYLVYVSPYGKIEVYADRIEGQQVVTFSTERCDPRISKKAIEQVRKAALTCFRVLDHTKESTGDGVSIAGGLKENSVFLHGLSFVIGFGSALGVALHKAKMRPRILQAGVLGSDGRLLSDSIDDWLIGLIALQG